MIENMKRVTLGDVCEKVDYGHTASAKETGDGPKFLRITDIQNGSVDWDGLPVCECELKEREKYGLDTGDIVFARTGATTGKSYLVSDCPIDVVFASYLIRIRPKDQVLSTYLAYFFQTPEYWEQISISSSGSAQPGVNATKLKTLQIPLPSLAEQQRIVTMLDEAFEAIEIAKANTKKNLANSKELFQSKLNEIFSQKGDGWEEKKLGEIGKASMCKRIFKNETTVTGDVPFYKIGTFGKNPDAFITNTLYKEYKEKYRFPKKGDVLISASGTIGRTVFYDGEPSYFQDSNIVWIDNDEKIVTNLFLNVVYKNIDWGESDGATIKRLYNSNLENIVIPYPELQEEQKQIVHQLDILKEQTQSLESNYQQKLNELDDLKNSILHKAFKGELTADKKTLDRSLAEGCL